MDEELRKDLFVPQRRSNSRIRNHVFKLAAVTALSGLLFGFDTAVINGALIYLQRQFQMSVWQTELAASSLLVGAILGAAVSGRLSDIYGRRCLLSISALIFALSSIATAFSSSLLWFAVARFAGGISIGAGSVLAPLYLTEIAPADCRGRIVTINQLAIVSGILIAYFTNWLLSSMGPSSWRWMFGVGVIPSLALWIGLLCVPESPRWLIQKGRDAEAEQVLRAFSLEKSAPEEIKLVHEAIQAEQDCAHQLWAMPLRRPMIIAVLLALFSQVTGINAVLYYGSLILQQRFTEQTAAASIGANVLIGTINFLATIAALIFIDKLGRRTLLLTASGGMFFSLLWTALLFAERESSVVAVLLGILSYVCFFAFGMAPTMWAYISEIFPNAIRARAVSLATVGLWSATLLVTLTFLSLSREFGISGAFLIYAGFSLLTFMFVWKKLPETRGRTLEEIQELWKR